MRANKRSADKIRPVSITPDYLDYADGSALIEIGKTKVVAGATIEEKVRGDRVVLGIRPEHVLAIAEARRKGLTGQAVPATVDLVQPLARKKIVDLKMGDSVIKMLIPSVSSIAKGEELEVVFDPRKVHLFDQGTGISIVS